MSPPAGPSSQSSSALIGSACAVAAFLMWGIFPVYFKAVAEVPALEVLSHRVVWSVVFVAGVVTVLGRWDSVAAVIRQPKLIATLSLSATVISVNWGMFIWAISHDRVLASSLGYFINPLVSVLLGVLVLGERLRRAQWVAVGLAAIGVAYQLIAYGTVPWIALILACSFGFYGLIRKTAAVDAYTGLLVETTLLSPLAIGYLVFLGISGQGAFGAIGWQTDALVMASGVVTALPLMLFVACAQRIRLSTVGLFQYIAPTGHFLLAVYAYGEPLTTASMVTFAFIWSALVLYTVDSIRHERRR